MTIQIGKLYMIDDGGFGLNQTEHWLHFAHKATIETNNPLEEAIGWHMTSRQLKNIFEHNCLISVYYSNVYTFGSKYVKVLWIDELWWINKDYLKPFKL